MFLFKTEKSMKDKAHTYKPIACHLHDHIESSIVKKQRVHLTYDDPDTGKTISCNTLLTDWYVKEGAEYVVLDNHKHLRLDYLRAFHVIED